MKKTVKTESEIKRITGIGGLLNKLKGEGVAVIGEIEEYDYGKFACILDPEGNKIELWEPKDVAFSS